MSFQGSVTRLAAVFGAAYTVWRHTQGAGSQPWKAGAPAEAFYPCRARGRNFSRIGQAIQGTVSERESVIVVDASTIAVAPQKGDRIAKGTYAANQAGAIWQQITAVEKPGDGSAVPLYRLTVSG